MTGATYGLVPALTGTLSVLNTSFSHTYSAVNQRLTQSASDSGWISYPSGPTTSTSYSTNALNQYTAVGSVVPTYDNNGNLLSEGTNTYGYDAENRLVSASGGGNTAAYAFEGRGRRKSRTVNGTTTISITDPDNREVLEYDGSSGAILRWYAWGLRPNDLLSQNNLGGTPSRASMILDLLGSVVGTMSNTGTFTKFGYRVYGVSTNAPAQFGYTGQRVDSETGLYYYRARHYSPVLGRFLQTDPIGYSRPGALNCAPH